MSIKTCLANVLWFLHIAIVAFVILGWLCSDRSILYGHLIFLPLMVVHWKMNREKCILTQWERRLRKPSLPIPAKNDGPNFIASMLIAVTGKMPNERILNQLIYGLVYLSFALSAGRLLLAF